MCAQCMCIVFLWICAHVCEIRCVWEKTGGREGKGGEGEGGEGQGESANQRLMLAVFYRSPLTLWGRVSHWTWSISTWFSVPDSVHCLARKPQGSTRPLCSAGITGMHSCTKLLCGFWRSELMSSWFFFETGFHFVDLAVLELLVWTTRLAFNLPLPLECWY